MHTTVASAIWDSTSQTLNQSRFGALPRQAATVCSTHWNSGATAMRCTVSSAISMWANALRCHGNWRWTCWRHSFPLTTYQVTARACRRGCQRARLLDLTTLKLTKLWRCLWVNGMCCRLPWTHRKRLEPSQMATSFLCMCKSLTCLLWQMRYTIFSFTCHCQHHSSW